MSRKYKFHKADGQVLFDNAAYGQNNTGPHALTSAETAPGVFPEDAQFIIYNSFDKVTGIYEGRPPVYKELTIQYGHHRERISQQYSDGQNTIDKVWAGSCEYITENGQTTTLTYLSGPEGVFAQNPNGSENIRYIHKDHLGSWNTITDENGNLLQELSFDPWGTRRDPATWRAFTVPPADPLFDRGFTGHEHLYGFQLINMNGRMYDPVVSRMLSPDNFIQAPDFSQSFNRYSYVWNNPLVLTDPSGEMAMYYAMGLFIVGSVIENAINYKDYGHKSVGDVIKGGYSQGMNAYNEIQSVTSFTVYQNENFSLSVGLSMTGLGVNTNMSYKVNNFNLGIGGGFNSVVNPELSAMSGSNSFEFVPQLSGGIGYANDNFSFNYYQTYYGGMHKQRVGGINASFGEFSFRFENDFFAGTGDKWRSNALEIGVGNAIGANIVKILFVIGLTAVIGKNILFNANDF